MSIYSYKLNKYNSLLKQSISFDERMRYTMKLQKYNNKMGGSNNLTIYSFNVLNPDIETAKMTFNSVFKSMYDGDFKKIDPEAKAISTIDFARFPQRMDMILEVIDSWLINDYAIVNLQEVNRDLLNVLKAKYGVQLATTNVDDYVFFGKPTARQQAFKDEHRVTIVGKGIKIITASDIEITNDDARKNCLHTFLSVNDQYIHSFNVHFHWKSSKDHITKYGKIMKNIASCKPFYICGDFNRSAYHESMIELQEIMTCSALPSDATYTSGATTPFRDDKVLYPEMPDYKVAFIDNILFGNCTPVSEKLQALYVVNEMEIFYNLNEIRIAVLSSGSYVFPERRFVSDHVPVTLTLQL